MTSTPPSCFARVGLDAPRFGDVVVRLLEEMNFPPGTGINDPIDAPDGTLPVDSGRVAGPIMDVVHASGEPDAFVMHVTVPVFTRLLHKLPQACVGQAAAFSTVRACRSSLSRPSFLFIERTGLPAGRIMRPVRRMKVRRRVSISRKRHGAVHFAVVPRVREARGGPVFDELSDAAGALAAMRHHARLPRKRR